jgi:oligopeptide/dipeptide ABC transporter ATP-binding protein
MYAGRILERGPTGDTFAAPRHPYTLGLLRATPDVDDVTDELYAIPGSAPGLRARPPGCPFHPRCAVSSADCASGDFPLRAIGSARATACAFPERIASDHKDADPAGTETGAAT